MVNASAEPPEFERLREIADPFLRRLYFVAILTKYLPPAARPVVVGGHALQFHTSAHYATGPVELACPDRRGLDALLTSWGFDRQGRHWGRDDLELYLEAPGEALEGAEADRVVEGEIEGLPIFVISAEDLLVDRLNAYVHWKYAEDAFWALQIIRTHAKDLDWAYLERRCEDKDTLAALLDMRRRWESEVGEED